MMLNNQIKQIRMKIGLSQVEFAKRIGIGLRCLREIEQGKPTIRLDKLNQVLYFLGYHLEMIRNTKEIIKQIELNKFAYGLKWNPELRRKIRKRDNFECQLCLLSDIQHREKYKRPLCIHHIDYNKINCKEKNLITLCFVCHGKTNGNRKYWKNYFIKLMDKKYPDKD